jgi:hypothetical protein
MTLTRRVALGFALVLITLTPRLIGARSLTVTSFDDHGLRDATLRHFLEQSGVSVSPVAGTDQVPILRARRGTCISLVANMSPQGVHEALLRQLARTEGYEFSVEFRGQNYARQPRWETYSYDFWRKAAGLFGSRVPVGAVTAILTPPGCRLDDLKWADIDAH